MKQEDIYQLAKEILKKGKATAGKAGDMASSAIANTVVGANKAGKVVADKATEAGKYIKEVANDGVAYGKKKATEAQKAIQEYQMAMELKGIANRKKRTTETVNDVVEAIKPHLAGLKPNVKKGIRVAGVGAGVGAGLGLGAGAGLGITKGMLNSKKDKK